MHRIKYNRVVDKLPFQIDIKPIQYIYKASHKLLPIIKFKSNFIYQTIV
jgi:hypothetical protein